MHVGIVIPALDEAETIGPVVTGLLALTASLPFVRHVVCVVGDNGSTDDTAAVAQRAGAEVVAAPRRGYGSACLAALKALGPEIDTVLFADGDGSDDPSDIAALLAPLEAGEAEMVIGSRALGEAMGWVEPGALTPPQRFGNRLATTILQVGYGMHFSDLGPFRAVTRDALARMRMDDQNFGWTVQMQARAARLGIASAEVAVHYRRRRGGESKVAGNLKGSVMAGVIILRTLFAERPSRTS